MELRHVRYFVAVADALSFHRAAQRLHITQPALSRQIKDLERELGVTLLERGARGVQLTEAGHVFLDEGRQLLRQADRAMESARHAALGVAGRLRIGHTDPAAYAPLLGQIVRTFQEQHPRVEIQLVDRASAEQWQAIRSGELDVGFTYGVPGDRTALEHALLREAKLDCVILPAGHALAAGEEVALADLAAFPFITFPRPLNPDLFDQNASAFRERGLTPILGPSARAFSLVVNMVEQGLGWALWSGDSTLTLPERVAARPIAGGPLHIRLTLVWAAEPRPPVTRFVEAALAVRDDIEAARP